MNKLHEASMLLSEVGEQEPLSPGSVSFLTYLIFSVGCIDTCIQMLFHEPAEHPLQISPHWFIFHTINIITNYLSCLVMEFLILSG
jgi:hypothetical protein